MKTKIKDVKIFLQEFKQKLAIFDMIFYRSRSNNLQTVLDLELSNVSVRKHLSELTYKNYYKGPTKDDFSDSDLWEFGKEIKNKKVYIKISLGNWNKQVLCISFHFPIHTIKYPFK